MVEVLTEQLEEIEARIKDCQTYKFGMRNADKLAHEDAPFLLELVRDLQRTIDRYAEEDARAFVDRMYIPRPLV